MPTSQKTLPVHRARQQHRSSLELDWLAQRAAHLYYERQYSQKEISSALQSEGVKGIRDVASLLKRALDSDRPLVKIHVEPEGGALAGLDEELGQRLVEPTGIRRVLAVKIALPTGSTTEDLQENVNAAFVRSHLLHRQLGGAAGRFIWDRITDRDVIAVGAGRGVRFTVDAIRSFARTEHRAFKDLQVVALAGTGVVRPYRESTEPGEGIRDWPELEADQIALELGRVLNVDVTKITLARLPFVLEERDAVIQAVAPHLAGAEWQVPDKAIFGLGVLNSTHHLMASKGSSVTAVVQDTLDALDQEVLSLYEDAVVDIYDSFWVREDGLPPEILKRATELVKRINDRIVVAPLDKTNEAREKILVAGGRTKYNGLLAYIKQQEKVGVRPTVLVTDEETASRLLVDLRGRERP